MKLAAALDTTPELWINAQRNVDMYDARQGLSEWKPTRVFGVLQPLEDEARTAGRRSERR